MKLDDFSKKPELSEGENTQLALVRETMEYTQIEVDHLKNGKREMTELMDRARRLQLDPDLAETEQDQVLLQTSLASFGQKIRKLNLALGKEA